MRRIAPYARVLRAAAPAAALAFAAVSQAQQTLGNLNGTVTDATGAAISGAQVQLSGDANGVKLTTSSKKDGTYQFKNLPVGSYTLLFLQQGFESERVPAIQIDYALNLQWQATRDIVLTFGYTGNLGRHLVIPVPFNEPGIATPTNPINGETSSYGYEVLNTNKPSGKYYSPISTEPYDSYDGGNIDLRVPYVGYSPNAALFKAAGVSEFNAFEFHALR